MKFSIINIIMMGLRLAILFFLFTFISCDVKSDNKDTIQYKAFTYYIECNQNDFDKIYSNWNEKDLYIPISITYNGQIIGSAKMRLRGDSSREYDKKSLKIVFKKGEMIEGLPRKINLNSEWTDKSYMRQFLSSIIFEKAGIPVFKSNFAKIYINNKFFGLYLQVENIDNDFLTSRGIDKNGNLYKATKDGACLSIYDNIGAVWEKKTNKYTDWIDLEQLINNIDTISVLEFDKFLKNYFDYDNVITVVAVNMLIQNSSTYYHNYYMYHDIYGTNKWRIFPWDLDKTMSYYCWQPYKYHKTTNKWLSNNPLVEKILINDVTFDDVVKKVNELGETVFNNNVLDTIIDKYISLLEEAVANDTSDQIQKVGDWKYILQSEKDFISRQVEYLNNQFTRFPRSFELKRIEEIQITPPKLEWNYSKSPKGEKLSYILYYGTDYLFEDSSKTNVIENINENFYQLPENLSYGKYYWKVIVTDGENKVEGFNTKNSFFYSKPTIANQNISTNRTWTSDKSPYYITNDITILNNATLTIEKGVNIILKEDANIYVEGDIIVDGQKGKQVVFRPENKQWGHLYLLNNKGNSVFNYTIFNEGVFRSKGANIAFYNCEFNIKRKNLLYDGYRQAVIWVDKGKFLMDNCKIYGHGLGEGMNINRTITKIKDSYFNNLPDAIEIMDVVDGEIYRNYIENSPDDAIDMNGCSNVKAYENYIINNNDKAISVGTEEYGPSTNISIYNNLIINNGTGISIKDSSDATIYNNTIVSNNIGVKAYLKNNIKQYEIGGRALVYNTIFYNIRNMEINSDENSDIQVSYSLSNRNSLKGQKNLNSDPGFVNEKLNNYYLTKSSVCNNSGKDNDNIGCYSLKRKFLIIEQKEDCFVLRNPNLFPVNIGGYKILINNKDYLLPNYSLNKNEEIILTSNAKNINSKFDKYILEFKILKNVINMQLKDKDNNIIFTLNE